VRRTLGLGGALHAPDPPAGGASAPVRHRGGVRSGTWLTWSALSIVVAVGGAYLVAAALRSVEASIVTFALGMAWSAATPRVLRRIR
jgi:hypothetical protein